MKGDEEAKASELVIIRRRGGDEEGGHHGGVWKIAYADFMTAMMAFFLVMWLINSTDKKTLTQVATYFNPLRLTDKAPSSRGLHQSEAIVLTKDDNPSAGPPQQPGLAKSDATAQGKGEAAKPKIAEEALFRDPQGLLEKLAAQAEADQKPSELPARRPGSEAYRDPFEPAFRREPLADRSEKIHKPQPNIKSPPPADAAGAATAGERALPPPSVSPSEPAAKEAEVRKAAEQATAKEAEARKAAERAEAQKLDAEIKQVIAQSRPGTVPHIDVRVTDEGVLISLTDDYEFGMFAIASAEPRPALVVVMEKLGRILADQTERLVVRGHTDGRPYKSGTYDNWRLSSARAHMAYYMLLRGGIDEKRFERVEGHADRNLRLPDDPEAAENRRIEILLRRPKG